MEREVDVDNPRSGRLDRGRAPQQQFQRRDRTGADRLCRKGGCPGVLDLLLGIEKEDEGRSSGSSCPTSREGGRRTEGVESELATPLCA
jgi:hypothetical protein